MPSRCLFIASASDNRLCLLIGSELAGPQQDVQGARSGGERNPAAPTQVLLFRPERGLQGPGPAEPALCSGEHARFMLALLKKEKDNLLVLPLCCTPTGRFMDYPAITRVFKVRQRAA